MLRTWRNKPVIALNYNRSTSTMVCAIRGPTVVCTLTDLSNEATSMVTVDMENFVIEPGLLVLKHEAKVSANEYGIHKHRARSWMASKSIRLS